MKSSHLAATLHSAGPNTEVLIYDRSTGDCLPVVVFTPYGGPVVLTPVELSQDDRVSIVAGLDATDVGESPDQIKEAGATPEERPPAVDNRSTP